MARKSSQAEVLASRIAQLAEEYGKKTQIGTEANEEIKSISSLCTELSALINPPNTWVDRIALSYNSSVAIRLLLDMRVFQRLAETHGATSLDTLATLSGCSQPILRSALRECVEQHILDEVSHEVYQLNNKSAYLLDENSACWVHYLLSICPLLLPKSLLIPALPGQYRTDVGLHSAAYLPEYISGTGEQQPPEPSPTTAFQMAFKTDQSFYEWLRNTDAERGRRFDKGLQRHIRGAAQTSIENIFDFNQLRPGACVVDVGGGKGQHSIRIARQHPRLSFIIQDHEKTWPTEDEVSGQDIFNRVKWQQHDYFEEQPVKGADLYLLSNIMMDNVPRDCRTILGRIADAMTPFESVLLVDDGIDLGAKQCNSSYGNSMTMHMLACLGTMFRTSTDWEILFSQVSGGLSVTNSWVVDGGRVIFELRRTT